MVLLIQPFAYFAWFAVKNPANRCRENRPSPPCRPESHRATGRNGQRLEGKVEGRRMNDEIPIAGGFLLPRFCILHSSFCICFEQSQIIGRIHLNHLGVNQTRAREQTNLRRILDHMVILSKPLDKMTYAE